MDTVCPPSTVFAAYNDYAGPKDISVWPFNGHEAGQQIQQSERYAFIPRIPDRPAQRIDSARYPARNASHAPFPEEPPNPCPNSVPTSASGTVARDAEPR